MDTIEPFIHRKVVVLFHDARVEQAARALCDRRVGCVVVADHSRHVVGIVTDRDLVCNALDDERPGRLPVSQVMTRGPIMAEETATIETVVRLMEQYGIRRIPIAHRLPNGREECVGIVTLDDLIAARAVDIHRLGRIVRREIQQWDGRTISLAADRRSESHRQETMNRFQKQVCEATGLAKEASVNVARVVLGALTRRMHPTGAAHLIAQLPHRLQAELMALPPGPDRGITLESIQGDLAERCRLSPDAAEHVLRGFCSALTEMLDPRSVEHFKSQLPRKMWELFQGKGKAEAA